MSPQQLADTLTALLDDSRAARRPEPEHALWLAPAGFGRHREAEALLTRVLDTMHASGCHLRLLADASLESADLGTGSWRLLSEGQWQIAGDFDAAQFLRSQAHIEGGYTFVVTSSTAGVVELRPDLPWWGPSRWSGRVERIRSGLRRASIAIALAVHHDASDWIIAIAGE